MMHQCSEIGGNCFAAQQLRHESIELFHQHQPTHQGPGMLLKLQAVSRQQKAIKPTRP
jgi:hypothetical protein